MSQQHGEFTNSIIKLDNAQEQVKTVWCDETAKSFDCLNNNVKLCTQKIWSLYCDCRAGVDALNRNYDSDAFDRAINSLNEQIERV